MCRFGVARMPGCVAHSLAHFVYVIFRKVGSELHADSSRFAKTNAGLWHIKVAGTQFVDGVRKRFSQRLYAVMRFLLVLANGHSARTVPYCVRTLFYVFAEVGWLDILFTLRYVAFNEAMFTAKLVYWQVIDWNVFAAAAPAALNNNF